MGTSTVLMVIVMHRFVSFFNGMDGSLIFYRLMYAMGWSWWCLLFCCVICDSPACMQGVIIVHYFDFSVNERVRRDSLESLLGNIPLPIIFVMNIILKFFVSQSI